MRVNLNQEVAELVRNAGLPVAEFNRFHSSSDYIEFDLRQLSDGEFKLFEDTIANTKESVGIRRQISSWRKVLKDPNNAKPKDLKVLEAALIDFMVNDAIEGWLFKLGPVPYPAVLTSVKYAPSQKDSPAHVFVEMRAKNDSRFLNYSMVIYGDDIKGKSLVEIIADCGWQKETPELLDDYEKAFKYYLKMKAMFGKQLRLTSKIDYNTEKDYWAREKKTVDLLSLGQGRVVCNHVTKDKGKIDMGRSYTQKRSGSGLRNVIERVHGEEAKPFSTTPWDLDLTCFHLEAHVDVEVHANYLKPYKYDRSIRDKLILPEELMELLDTLTEELDLVQEDIVEGKTGGNVILCAGRPGLGKTLTAEVYSEWRGAPLYKVHSGMLGTVAKEIEENLVQIYQRASSWGNTIVLLDEFDVFGRERSDNLEQNAVVAVFLRSLEYQNNTIFLTTNRHDNMDDAILSRCAAILSYGYPREGTLVDMYKTMRNQFLPSVTDEMIEELANPQARASNDSMSGRDIKNIFRLAAKYERTGHEVTIDLLRKCARFRGIQAI